MLNEQLTRPTPFSRIDQPDLAWRTEAHEENPAQKQKNLK
jgi:hypothetical protein